MAGPHYYALRADSDIGGEVYERRLLERLPAHGIDVILGLPRDHATHGLSAGVRGDVLRHGRRLHWFAAPLLFTPYTVRLLRRSRVDVLRGHSVRYTGPSLLLARALVRARVPVVVHHHHLEPRWAGLEAAILRRADAVITVSEHSRQALIAAGVAPDRIHVVYDGVERPPPSTGWPEAWVAGGVRLLCLGRLEQRKRPDLALEALAQLRRGGLEASLVVAGDGPMRQALEQRRRELELRDAVRFLGRVSEEQKWRLYDSADVLMFGSTLEGFGLVVAEAQSRGVPVVAAAGTATAEALAPGRSGLLVAPEAEAFSAAVLSLADPVVRQAMGTFAQDFARRFDWDVCAAGVAEVLFEVARGR